MPCTGTPKFLILDEGTANLDEQNEALIADLIDQMNITRIVVAHRPMLLRRAKRVFAVGGRKLSPVAPSVNAERLTPILAADQAGVAVD